MSDRESRHGLRRETCILAGLDIRSPPTAGPVAGGDVSASDSLEELAELAASADCDVVGTTLQVRDKAEPSTFFGSGKVSEISGWAKEADVDFVLVDQNLTPSQQRNLEKALKKKVIDRTQLILDIFARHARTREGKLQVELAQLNYMIPRLSSLVEEMSRLGGGVGTRGPGEQQLETDRRRVRRRVDKLRADLRHVRSTRDLQRKKRAAVPLSTVALVGYTNAGKSTLFNALTRAGVLAEQRMFATLDPTIRAVTLPSRRKVLLSDTVGFIRGLPPGLVEAFRATLEEVHQATLILLVVDASSPHYDLQIAEVKKVLESLEAQGTPALLVLNKLDLAPRPDLESWEAAEAASTGAQAAVAVSSKTGDRMDALLATIDRILPADLVEKRDYHFPHDDAASLSFLYDHALVTARKDTEAGVDVSAEAPESVRFRLRSFER